MNNSIIITIGEEKIKVCQNVIFCMRQYVQKGALSKEAGGVLIGKENKSNKNIVINNITNPMAEDKRELLRFVRKDKGHVDIFQSLYQRSNKTLRYIGEWHTHAEAIPMFSHVDLKNWEKISKKSNDSSDFYHIIVGFEAIKLWKFNGKTLQVMLIGTIFWKDLEYY